MALNQKSNRNYFIYLHGFNSWPKTQKAMQLEKAILLQKNDDKFVALDLHLPPKVALKNTLDFIARLKDYNVVLVGSSYGGFFATYLSDCLNLRAVLINPALHPYDFVREYLGDLTNPFTGKTITITKVFADDLRQMYVKRLTHPENILLLLTQGDEILDYRKALIRYPDSQNIVLEGGNHAFSDFAQVIPDIFAFVAQ